MSASVVAVRNQVIDFIELTKPRITLLVLVTAFAAIWLATAGAPSPAATFFSLLGIAMASAASGVFNNYLDREVDGCMARTRNRALPDGRLYPRQALVFGLLLAAMGFGLLFLSANPLTAFLAMATIFFYALVYTRWLKRNSAWCTEIGGIAGAMPPVLGWAAATNQVDWPAVLLFVVLLLWQPPHFWALALLRADEYRAAGLKMLPVTRGEAVTKRHMVLYTLALLPTTAAIYSLGLAGPYYLVVALAASVWYLAKTLKFGYTATTRQGARNLFGYSIFYLAILFVMIFVDCRCGNTMY